MPQVGACLLTSGSTCLQVGLLNRGLIRSFGWGPITSRRGHSALGLSAGGSTCLKWASWLSSCSRHSHEGGGYTCAPGKEIKHVSSAEEKNERLLN